MTEATIAKCEVQVVAWRNRKKSNRGQLGFAADGV